MIGIQMGIFFHFIIENQQQVSTNMIQGQNQWKYSDNYPKDSSEDHSQQEQKPVTNKLQAGEVVRNRIITPQGLQSREEAKTNNYNQTQEQRERLNPLAKGVVIFTYPHQLREVTNLLWK